MNLRTVWCVILFALYLAQQEVCCKKSKKMLTRSELSLSDSSIESFASKLHSNKLKRFWKKKGKRRVKKGAFGVVSLLALSVIGYNIYLNTDRISELVKRGMPIVNIITMINEGQVEPTRPLWKDPNLILNNLPTDKLPVPDIALTIVFFIVFALVLFLCNCLIVYVLYRRYVKRFLPTWLARIVDYMTSNQQPLAISGSENRHRSSSSESSKPKIKKVLYLR